MTTPAISVVIPTFNNVDVLRECLRGWEQHGGPNVEVIVVEDGCRDATPAFLDTISATPWGRSQLRWIHENDAHELRCTNSGFAVARAPLLMAWQDDMFLRAGWLAPELVRTFEDFEDIGLVSLSRGLNCLPADGAIERWEDLIDERRLQSTIGPAPGNWFRLQEVDAVIRPWILRRACVERVGVLDEAFRPTEWDEADLAFRIRGAGWRVATCGYERLGAYFHRGSTTIGRAALEPYRARVLANGRLFHARWDATIEAAHERPRRTWRRRMSAAATTATFVAMARMAVERAGRKVGA